MHPHLSAKWREFLVVSLLFAVLTTALTFPVIMDFRTKFASGSGDGLVFAWNMWWFREAVFVEHTTPFHTKYIHHPFGTDLLLHTMSTFNCLISIPLQWLFRMETVYNLIYMFSFIASGVGMYYLARHLVVNRYAAFVAGLIFTFCPYHFAHARGHLNLVAMQWMPVYVLYLLRTRDEGGMRNASLAGVFLILSSLCSWYYMVYMILMSMLILGARAKRLFAERTRLKELGWIFVIFLVVLGPLLGAMAHVKLSRTYQQAHDPEVYSAEIASFIVPTGISIYGKYTESLRTQWSKGGSMVEFSNYLGITVLLLSIAAVIYVKEARFWGVSALLFLILSLGPHPVFMGQRYAIPLPYPILEKCVPFLAFTGMPTRFDVMVKFCMAILVALAMAHWFRREYASAVVKWAVPVVATVVIMAEYLPIPARQYRYEVPPFFEEMARDPEKYGIIDIPSGGRRIYGTTIHRKPVVGPGLARREVYLMRFVGGTPVINALIYNAPLPRDVDIPRLARSIFARNNIRYVITRDDAKTDLIENRLRLKLIDNRGGIKVYDCR